MGNKQNKQATTTNLKSHYNPEVEVVSPKSHNVHYGEVKVVKVKETGKVLLLKEIVVNSKKDFDAEVEFLNSRVNLSHPNVAEIVGFNTHEQSNFCATHYKINIFIEDLQTTLEAVIDEKTKNGTYASELELLQVADALITALSSFEAQGVNHGDIRPANVFASGTTYKLSDPSTAPQKGQNALSLAIINGKKTNLAPELVAQVPKQNFEIKSSKAKHDVFGSGLTLLALATLTNSDELYNLEEGTFNESILNAKLHTAGTRYSAFTTELIAGMLNAEAEKRPDFANLSNTLLPYQDRIRNGGEPAQVEVQVETTETIKRSALPETYTSDPTDDLEARIKAALERSEATYKAVMSSTPTTVNDYTYGKTSQVGELAKSYVNANTYSNTYTTTTAAPLTTTANYTYTPINYTTPASYTTSANYTTPATTYVYNTSSTTTGVASQ